jgi:hypothetical protein
MNEREVYENEHYFRFDVPRPRHRRQGEEVAMDEREGNMMGRKTRQSPRKQHMVEERHERSMNSKEK